jgi:hypothetical protein
MAVYLATQNPEIEVEKLTHFALGLFWKASVHSWRGDTTRPRIDLGPYSEEIRKWLRGQNAFPKYVYPIAERGLKHLSRDSSHLALGPRHLRTLLA